MAENRQTPVAGQIYKHFKGNLYKVLAVAVHTESEEKLVVYQSVENPDRVFARPLEMFMSDIDRFRYPLIRAKYRFTLVSEPEEETNGEETKEEETKEETPNEDTKEEDVKDEETEEQSDDDSAVYKDNGELVIDPYVERVLDEKEFSKKIEFFEMLRGKCSEDMLTTIAISLDIQLQEGSIEDKYSQILRTLKMHEKYETSRLRG
ncbi:MAG: DUF1653 domain-containing protein [Lachnospiraceae bacterium]|nr:DUF1653 domain-containing protein [Lachnospiraceae bacterium]